MTTVCRAALKHAQCLQMEGRMLGRGVGGRVDRSLSAGNKGFLEGVGCLETKGLNLARWVSQSLLH